MTLPNPRYELDLRAVKNNYLKLRHHLPKHVDIFCCLKKNAYGCGARSVASALDHAGAVGFAASTLADAAEIRSAVFDKPILLYGGTLVGQVDTVERLDLIITIGSTEEALEWNKVLQHPRNVFIKVDVGLLRFGFSNNDLAVFLNDHRQICSNLNIIGVYTHLSEKADMSVSDVKSQQDVFDKAVVQCRACLPELKHVCASSTETVFSHRMLDYNMVDVGSLLYGLASPDVFSSMELESVVSKLVARITFIKTVSPNAPNHIDLSSDVKRIGIVNFGWGDGFPRHVSSNAFVLVRGKPVGVLGPVHLEQIRLDLTDIDAEVGDEVVILGHQNGSEISTQDLAVQWSVSIYEIFCNIRPHIKKIYRFD